MRRLLIVSCSARKNQFDTPHPAWLVYDGVAFRSLKKIEREGKWPKDLDVLILSAEFGLISPDFLICNYDRSMTSERADEIAGSVARELEKQFEETRWSVVVLGMGQTYLKALREVVWPAQLSVGVIPGRVGVKLKLMKRWILNPEEANPLLLWHSHRIHADV